MVESEARVGTSLASRYLAQLCKHFAHKLAVSHDGTSGSIAFDSGNCALHAEGDVLVMRCQAPDAATLQRVQDVIDRHLARFAFRDKPQIAWQAMQASRETFWA